MKKFRKNYYSRWKDFRDDFQFLISRRSQIRKAMAPEQVSAAFRERLMLVVTEVNGCRYCRSFHAPQAFKAGVPQDELRDLLAGLVPDSTPEREQMALVYAKHWAENNAIPSPEYDQKMIEVYGENCFQAIQIILRMIRMGNLLGNTGDYVLYRLSFGLFGGGGKTPRANHLEES
jgi:AhpD family alkylhydroperoxidase